MYRVEETNCSNITPVESVKPDESEIRKHMIMVA